MDKKVGITHSNFQNMLNRLMDNQTPDDWSELLSKEPEYRLLLELMHTLINVRQNNHIPEKENHTLTFSKIESLMLDLFSNQLTGENAERLFNALYHSPVIFNRILTVLHGAARTAPEIQAEVESMPMKSDDFYMSFISGQIKSSLLSNRIKEFFRRFFIKKHGNQTLGKTAMERIKPIPRWGFAVPALLAAALVCFVLFRPFRESYTYYIYKNRVPYKYDLSSLRSATPATEEESLLNLFVEGFRFTMGDYLLQDYLKTIENFQRLNDLAGKLKTALPDSSAGLWLREYYFYWGLSHLAQSVKERSILRQHHENQSVYRLNQAYEIGREFIFENQDRDIYYLGLACLFKGESENARKYLGIISPGSRFHTDARKLINR